MKIKEEVKKLLDAGFIKVAHYPRWVANVVLIPNKDGRVRMSIDFRGLNNTSPKDDFPLPHIYVLVNNHTLLSFMDGYVGYN